MRYARATPTHWTDGHTDVATHADTPADIVLLIYGYK